MATETYTTSEAPPHRSYSFPLSHLEHSSRISPFTIRKADQDALDASESFQKIRTVLAHQQGTSFCDLHDVSSPAEKAQWLLHRDITHAVVLPVLHIHTHAASLARAVLCSASLADQELAFRGDARGAFAWLQCLRLAEDAWCAGRGCPACVVAHSLASEPTIRLVLVACRLARLLRPAPAAPGSPALPSLDFWRAALRRAVDRDAFWGPTYAKEIEARAERLEPGIRELVRQCSALSQVAEREKEMDGEEEAKTAAPSAAAAAATDPEASSKPQSQWSTACPTPWHAHAGAGVRRARSVLGKDDAARNEPLWTQRVVLGCWSEIMAEADSVQCADGIPEVVVMTA